MATSPNRINALLDVFDRADVLEAQTREQLLASAQALDPQRDPVVLASAVDAHFAEQAPSPPSLAEVAPPFSFSWKRPANPEEQQKRLKRTRWLAWLDIQDDAMCRKAIWAATGGGALAGMSGLSWLFLSTAHQSPHPFLVALVLGGLAGSASGLIGLLGCFILHCLKRLYVLPSKQELSRKEARYLSHADTRAYLKAVFMGPLPILLEGDVQQLETLMKAHDDAEAKAEEAQVEQQRRMFAQRNADRLADRNRRLAQLVKNSE